MLNKGIGLKAGSVILALLLAGSLCRAAFVVLPNGRRLSGQIRVKRNGDVIITEAGVSRTLTKGQYIQVVGDKPPAFDQARQWVAAGQYDKAIPLLEQIIRESRGQTWDLKAMAELGRAQLGKGETSAAVSTFERLFRANPKFQETPVKWDYFSALLAAKATDKLSLKLDALIEKGSRADAARAQIMRGDIKAAQADIEGAAMDYLRTVILFKAQTEQQPEALYKAGAALEKMHDARAKQMFETLLKNYPNSSWAGQARQKH